MSKQLKGDLLLIVVTMIWGGTFPLVKNALAGVGPLSFVAIRLSIAFAAMLLLCVIVRVRWNWQAALAGALLGVLMYGGTGLQTVGLLHTTASKSGFITGLYVPLAPLLSGLLLRERPGLRPIIGVAMSTVGLALLSLRGDLSMSYGDLLTVGCALFWTFHVVFTGKFSPVHNVLTLTTVQYAVTAAIGWPVAFATENPFNFTTTSFLVIVFMGVVATAGCFTIQAYTQSFTSPTHTVLVLAMEPVFAGLFSYLFLSEVLGIRSIGGCALIVAGMVVAELKIGLGRRGQRAPLPEIELEG